MKPELWFVLKLHKFHAVGTDVCLEGTAPLCCKSHVQRVGPVAHEWNCPRQHLVVQLLRVLLSLCFRPLVLRLHRQLRESQDLPPSLTLSTVLVPKLFFMILFP